MSLVRVNLKALSVVLIAVLCWSCNKSANKPAGNQADSSLYQLADTMSGVYENPKITELKAFLLQLDSTDMVSVPKASVKFKELFTGQTPQLGDSAFAIFQAFYDKVERELNTKHQSDTTNYEPLFVGKASAAPQKLKDYQKTLIVNGFKLSYSSEMTYIEQNRNFIAKTFSSFVTETMKAFLAQVQKENKEGFATDGVITISYKQLVDRNVWYDKFIAENPNFVLISSCKDYKKAYLTYLLCGYEKTQLYSNAETLELSDFYANAYSYLNSKYADSETANHVKSYLEAIKQKQSANANAVLKSYVIKGLIYSLK